MSDEGRHIHEDCTAHSGLSGRVTLIIWLAGLIATLVMYQIKLTNDMRSDVLQQLYKLEARVDHNENRLEHLERISRGGA